MIAAVNSSASQGAQLKPANRVAITAPATT